LWRALTQRFGKVPVKVQRRIKSIDDLEPLAALAERVLVAPSVADLDLP